MAWTLLEMLWKAMVDAAVGYYLFKGKWREWMSDKCMIQDCRAMATANTRGLCMKCYSAAKRKVEGGETTWEELEVYGLCKAERNPFDDAYSRIHQEGM